MELKKKVRRHIEELTRLAYERGYRDGAQSALAEIEKIAGEDLAKQLKEAPASLEAPAKTAAPDVRPRAALKRQRVQQRKAKPDGAAPKAATVQRCIQRLIASRGQARRDEVLSSRRGSRSRCRPPSLAWFGGRLSPSRCFRRHRRMVAQTSGVARSYHVSMKRCIV